MPFGFVVFGASGDLSYNKLIPSLFGLFKKGIIKNDFFVLGVGRTTYDDSDFRKRAEQSIKSKFTGVQDKIIGDFCMNVYYIRSEYGDSAAYGEIKKRIDQLSLCYKTLGNIIYNLATPPLLFEIISSKLAENGLIEKGKNRDSFQRLMIEKPFGYDLESAEKLNKIILNGIDDEQVFRVDHYLGKNTVQNILVFRFANTLFRDLWSGKYIDNIQIKFKEMQGVETRIEYFDSAGLLRDVFQNHILQLIALIAMEKPATFSAKDIRMEKLKVFKAIRPFDEKKLKEQIILGQYKGYRRQKTPTENSCTETLFTTKLFIDNKVWENVPIYVMAGKKMDRDESKITVVFRKNYGCLFCDENDREYNNTITFKIKPEQGVGLKFVAKVPGAKLCVNPFYMNFSYRDTFGEDVADDYESVILECIYGDHTIFWDKEAVELSWAVLDPLIGRLKMCSTEEKNNLINLYEPGSEGPSQINDFINKDGKEWL